ncbi:MULTISPECIES: ricin-type beta-trefoil lectin domain protein [Asticcacaulis]|uniref:ricin-type beta-trefoil lectin domain protein n=1 Tax=Asticcacaulis TaxID=76890 RepID=UPI001AE92725|nr:MULTISPECIES: ricin-type beta-trefoil lectin domain protein [Asticcacaulis]MBP2161667.1 hypothetical protein [Asticcacaulis solisilvae]MDR6802708.1 hypothetical protein [Asticcacaulis sp. BE141]
MSIRLSGVAAASVIALASAFGAHAQTAAQPPVTQLSIGTKFVEGFCLDIRQADGQAVINKCNAQASQAINYDENTGQILQNGKCVAAPTKGQPLALRACANGKDELWTFEADGTLKTDTGLCADVLNYQRDPGTAVIAWDCTATDNQKFFLTNIRKAASSTAAPPEVAAAPLKGQPVIASYFVHGQCLAVKGNGEIETATCDRKDGQTLNFASDSSGAIVQGGKCLTAKENGSALVMAACAKTPQQDWAFTSEGTLRNRAGSCADILKFDPRAGAQVIAWDCTATDNQKFYPALAVQSGTASLGAQLSAALKTANVTTLTVLAGYSPFNVTASADGKLGADDKGNITSTTHDTVVFGGAGVMTVNFPNGLASGEIKAQTGKVSVLPTDWSFFSGATAGTMKLK